MHFADRLHDATRRTGSPVCVGLDPVLESLPADLRAKHHDPLEAIAEFCRGVLHAAAPHAPAVKFQSACFERYGGRGVLLLEHLLTETASQGFVVVLDAKRGDIGISASHYAASARRTGAHAVTVSGYLGPTGVTPFLDAGLAAFVLVRTSNPDSDAVQAHTLGDGRTVAEMMADHVAALGASRLGACGLSDVGAVVGATKSSEGRALRARMPSQVFLVPGYGAQGGTAEDIRALLTARGDGVLVTASRSIIYAPGEGPWQDRVAAAAKKLNREVFGILC